MESSERVDRLVILDTGLFTGHQPMNDAWNAFRDFVARTDDLPVGLLVLGGELAHVIADAGHFLQEDAGPRIGELIADWLGSGP